MKNIMLTLIFAIAIQNISLAQDQKQKSEINPESIKSKFDLSLGTGFLGPKGLLGVGGDYHITDHHAVSMNVMADLNGSGLSLSYKYFDNLINAHKTNTFWDKCFFVFECETAPYLETGAIYKNPSQVSITSDAGKRIYDLDKKILGYFGYGFRSYYRSPIFTDFLISYQSKFSGGGYNLKSGVEQSSDNSYLALGNQSFGFSFSLGYRF